MVYEYRVDKEKQPRRPGEKAMAKVNEVILIYLEDTPVSFARVESILPDAKKGWYQIRLLMLQIPLQVVTWILKDEYITGAEFFMGGKKMRLEEVNSPIEEMPGLDESPPAPDENREKSIPGPGEEAKIISFSDLKKDHDPESG